MDETSVLRILDEINKITSKIDDLVRANKVAPDKYQSDNIEEISAALSKAQGEYAPLVATALMRGKLKDYKFEDLGELMRVVAPTLDANGLAIHTMRRNVDGAVVIHVTLRHKTGQWMESRMRIPSNNETLHEYNSLVKFHIRAIVEDMLGCYPIGEDDDGQEAMKRQWAVADKGTDLKTQATTDYKGPIYEPVTKKELEELHEELKGFEDMLPEILKKYGIRELADMDTKDWSSACKRIRHLKLLRSTVAR